jgi:hypothetical protein
MADTKTEKTVAEEIREAASRLRGESAETTPGPWRRHDTHLDRGGHTATVLTERRELNDVELVAWLPSWSHEPWADKPCWANSRWIALVHPGLAEPLAAWLEQAAVWHDQTTVVLTDPNHVLHHACGGVAGEDCKCFAHPLAVARALNGATS